MNDNTPPSGKRRERSAVGPIHAQHKHGPQPPRLKWLRLAFGLGRLAPGLAARIADRVWCSVPHYPPPQREQGWAESARGETLDTGQGTITTYQWGEPARPPVLLLHGWAGRATQMYAFIDPLLHAGYRVVAFDAPAHGESSGRQTNFLEMIHALGVVNDSYGPFEGVIAHSFGVPVSMRALYEGHLQTSAVVGISPPFDLVGMIDRFCAMLNISPTIKEHLRRRITRRLGKQVWERFRVDTIAGQLDTPALIIHDENDREVDIDQARQAAAHWPGARLVVTRGLGHRRILRAKDVVESAVTFIAEDGEKVASNA
ncbi:MAG TPA: alpha/beta fold hydrolase [Gammaproteobacteria bacterium]|nr:alpha/beta fold hydrolase [Gammaproteobacteria bacterium]